MWVLIVWATLCCSIGSMSSWFGTQMSAMASLRFLSLWGSSGLQTSSCTNCKFPILLLCSKDLFSWTQTDLDNVHHLLPLPAWTTTFPKRVLTSTSTTRATSAGTGCCGSSLLATWRSSASPSTCRTAHLRLALTCTPVRKKESAGKRGGR